MADAYYSDDGKVSDDELDLSFLDNDKKDEVANDSKK